MSGFSEWDAVIVIAAVVLFSTFGGATVYLLAGGSGVVATALAVVTFFGLLYVSFYFAFAVVFAKSFFN